MKALESLCENSTDQAQVLTALRSQLSHLTHFPAFLVSLWETFLLKSKAWGGFPGLFQSI